VLTIFVAPAAWQLWKTFKKAQAALDQFELNAGPLLRNANQLAERIGDLNALLAVAQEEAESAFVATAAAVRGVREGAAALTNGDREAENELEGDENGDDDESDEDAYERERRFPRDEERGTGRTHRPSRPRLRSRRPEHG
jgi:hypothetical protein